MEQTGILLGFLYSYVDAFLTFAIFYALMGESIRKNIYTYLIVALSFGTVLAILKLLNIDQQLIFIITLMTIFVALFYMFKRVWWRVLLVFFIGVLTYQGIELLVVIPYLSVFSLSIEEIKKTFHIHILVNLSFLIRLLVYLILRVLKIKAFQEEPHSSNNELQMKR